MNVLPLSILVLGSFGSALAVHAGVGSAEPRAHPMSTGASMPLMTDLTCDGCVGTSLDFATIGTDTCNPPGTWVSLAVFCESGECVAVDAACAGTPCIVYYTWSWYTPCDGTAAYVVSGCVEGSYSEPVDGPKSSNSGGILQVSLPKCDCELDITVTVNGKTAASWINCTACVPVE
ncbi:MAG: hypothetical protein AB1726_16945 [Planctomycetota bacterium]